MGSMNRRLQRLEANREDRAKSLAAEALRLLSDEDLQALDEATEEALERGDGDDGDFWDLFATTQEKSRRALDALFEELEAVQSGEEPPEDLSGLDLVRDVNEGDEEVKREYDRQNGYRIWKYYRKEQR